MKLSPRSLRVLTLGLVGALLGASTALAQGPTATDPASALYINATPQSIPANSARWYKFEYAGDKSQITVLMPNGAHMLVEFNVFTPEEMKSWWDTKPIGRGTAYQIDCDTGEENYLGECQSNDLKWVGMFNAPGTYYVQVVNYNTGSANFLLTVSGTGVSVGANPVPITPTPVPTPNPLLPVTGGIWSNALPYIGALTYTTH